MATSANDGVNIFTLLIDRMILASIFIDLYFLTTMDFVPISRNPDEMDFFLWSVIIVLSAVLGVRVFFYYLKINDKEDRILGYLEFIKGLKNPIVMVSSLVCFTAMCFHIMDNYQIYRLWENAIPFHITIVTFYLLYGRKFESNFWTPISTTINGMMINEPGNIIIFLPMIDDNRKVRYVWRKDRKDVERALGLKKFSPIPFLIKEKDNNHRNAVYIPISYESLMNKSKTTITLSRKLVNAQERTALSHILLWNLFELYQKQNREFNIPYNVKRAHRSFDSVETDQSYTTLDINPELKQIWSHETIVSTSSYIYDLVSKNRQGKKDDNGDSDIFFKIFKSGIEYYNSSTKIDHTALVCHFILLTSRYDNQLDEQCWIAINSAFADAAKIMSNNLPNLETSFESNPKLNQLLDTWKGEIEDIRLRPIENFIKYHDQIIKDIRIKQAEEFEIIDTTFTEIIDLMTTQLHRTTRLELSKGWAPNTRQLRREIVSGTTLALLCLHHRIGKVN